MVSVSYSYTHRRTEGVFGVFKHPKHPPLAKKGYSGCLNTPFGGEWVLKMPFCVKRHPFIVKKKGDIFLHRNALITYP